MRDAHDLGYDAAGTGGRRWARIYIIQYLGCSVQVCPCLREMSCSLVRVGGLLTGVFVLDRRIQCFFRLLGGVWPSFVPQAGLRHARTQRPV